MEADKRDGDMEKDKGNGRREMDGRKWTEGDGQREMGEGSWTKGEGRREETSIL